MHAHSFLVHSLLVAAATAAGPGDRRTRNRRQDGPVDDGTAADCSYYDTAVDRSYDCAYFEDNWFLTHEEFVDYNPSVGEDCSGITVGNSYCVEVNFGLPRTTTGMPTATTTDGGTSPDPTGDPKPSPTQPGLIDTCTAFYFAVDGDSCDDIAREYGTFTSEQFIEWNPAVGDDCKAIWAKTYYCVGVPGTPTAPPTTTTEPTATGSPKPSPTQPGLVDNCARFYFAESGDTCASIAEEFGTFSRAQFIKWNPAVGDDCKAIWADTYYCVGLPGTPTAPPTTTEPTPTGSPKPSPTQAGLIKSCNRFHFAVDGDNCANIVKKYGTFTVAQFINWNPAVGDDCKALWSKTYYCVGIPGTPTKPPTTTTEKPPAQTCNPTGPKLIQPGAVCGCQKWHKVIQGNNCASIISVHGITKANFHKWNPGVGANCKTLWLGYHVCIKK